MIERNSPPAARNIVIAMVAPPSASKFLEPASHAAPCLSLMSTDILFLMASSYCGRPHRGKLAASKCAPAWKLAPPRANAPGDRSILNAAECAGWTPS